MEALQNTPYKINMLWQELLLSNLLGDSCSTNVGSGGEGEPVSEYAGGGVSKIKQ